MMRFTQCARRGFTLVELLVVITIIGMLAGLVLGVMPTIKERGNRVQCSSNLRQIGMIMQAYASDYDGRRPYTGVAGDSANKHFGLLFPHCIRDERQFLCQGAKGRGYSADNKIDDAPEGNTRTETLKPGENTYAYAFGLGGMATQDSPLACDQLAVTSISSNQGWKKTGLGSNHSTAGANVLYMDGRVEFITATGEGFWPPRRPKMKAMEKGQAREPANADRAPDDAG